MKKIVINNCFGGFGLSALGLKRWAELKGKECYFFSSRNKEGKLDIDHHYPISIDEAEGDISVNAFTIPNPDEYLKDDRSWHEMSLDERKESNKKYEEVSLSGREIPRNDSDLIKVVEELGEKADGRFAKLKIVEIPDDVDWEIDEYDGSETIDEKHRSWS